MIERISNWIKSRGAYDLGVKIYGDSQFHKKRLLRKLSNSQNRGLLIYELNKILKLEKRAYKPSLQPTISPEEIQEKEIKERVSQYHSRVMMHQLPIDLHPRFIFQKQTFYQVLSLKIELNSLFDDDIDRAKIIIENIFTAWSFIDEVWYEIDYYLEHKRLLPTEAESYLSYSAQECVNERQKLYSRKSKREKTIAKMQQNIEAQKLPAKIKALSYKISTKSEELHQIELNIASLTKIINND